MALNLILTLLFGTQNVSNAVSEVLLIFGLWGLFKKCGLKGWYALIPCYRTYSLARCAAYESDGRILFAAEAGITLTNSLLLFLPEENIITPLIQAFSLAIALISFVYQIRLATALCKAFDQKKKWRILWVFFDFIPAIVWGRFEKYQPLWKVQDIEDSISRFFTGTHADTMDNGLTVNLEARTVKESLFKKKYLLRDIHLNIGPGRMVLLLGGSGAGKTTLLNAINGYEKADAEIMLNGENVYKDYKQMQYSMGFVPQQDLMRYNDTVLYTLLDTAKLRLPVDFSADERRARVDDVMDIFGLRPVQDELAGKLSGGQRKRLSIAMEFISNPALFILDEPDSGLDGVMARELMQQLRSIADQGKIVIVITHTPDRVADLFDDVIVLAKDSARTGRLAYYGGIAEARGFFGRDTMEQIVRCINRTEEGGEGRADEFVMKYAEVQHA